MLTEQGCRARRERLWRSINAGVEWVLITDPAHLVYFANFWPSPFVFNSQGARGALILGRDGSSILIADNAQEPFVARAFAAEKVQPLWYRCVESADDRRLILTRAAIERLQKCGGGSIGCEMGDCPAAIADAVRSMKFSTPLVDVSPAICALRRQKEPDEVGLIRQCLAAATTALHAAMDGVRAGMTELQVYRLIQHTACEAAGQPVIVYGDVVSGPRCEQIGGPPSERVIAKGELVLLDFSVVLYGYRGDFCNTFVCEGQPTARQREMSEACLAAMQAGERMLRAGVACRDVHQAVRKSLGERGLADHFPHHSGHGVGLAHPEPPYFVPESSETLLAGDVVTLEPGVYITGTGGMRFERNYLITPTGYELLSNHRLGLK